ncbi:MAG TPA: DNA repair protein RecO, partial [Chitinophagaceae bacterium]|nr:DNA repair protein RecO [Chitinophagaceae bacterium]
MVHKTKGLVLRSVKYGETSLIVTIFTELFGLQSYIVNGVRTASKQSTGKASHFQPSALLDMVVYHNQFTNLQRIKEFKWAHLYQHVLSDVRKNSVALFMVELLTKCLKEPEANAELFYFVEDAFLHLDEASDKITANFPLFFALHLAVFFGFRINDAYSQDQAYLDLDEGLFVEAQPEHPNFLEGHLAEITSQLLKTMQPHDLQNLALTSD